MTKYFGTDGVRGRANDTLTLDMALAIGKYIGAYYGKERHAKILIGKDTRLSGSMFEMALAAGATATGANVYLLGVCPTPSVAYLVVKEKFDCGVMISASHNPFYDNGIKLFNHEGKKMDDAVLEEIEAFMDGESEVEYAINDALGTAIEWHEGLELYESYLKECVNCDFSGMKIALDLANGSATATAAQVLSELGATLEVIHSSPNGVNINTKCGSTHPEELQELMRENKGMFDCGFAFDGDADRLIAVDENGDLITGDHTLYICGNYLKNRGHLKGNTVVTTVMANLGLYRAFDRCQIRYEKTDVGDKYVFENMEKNGFVLGGEQSGHIIFKEHMNTGDGLLSALKLLEVMKKSGMSLRELSEDLFIYPQLLINVEVKDKHAALQNEELLVKIREVEAELGEEGRILVRPSGTEPLVRVMVEAKTDALCEQYVMRIVDFIKAKGL